jgi:hypothetical protein
VLALLLQWQTHGHFSGGGAPSGQSDDIREEAEMARIGMADYNTIGNEVVSHWTLYGATRTVGGMTLAAFQALLDDALTKVRTAEDLDTQAAVAKASRDTALDTLETALVRYRDGVNGEAGRDSEQARTLPKIRRRKSSGGGGSTPSLPPGV